MQCQHRSNQELKGSEIGKQKDIDRSASLHSAKVKI